MRSYRTFLKPLAFAILAMTLSGVFPGHSEAQDYRLQEQLNRLNSNAEMAALAGSWQQARALSEQAFQIIRQSRQYLSPQAFRTESNLVTIYQRMGQPKLIVDVLSPVAELCALLNDDPPDCYKILFTLAPAMFQDRDAMNALPIAKRANAIIGKHAAPGSLEALQLKIVLGMAYGFNAQPDRGEKLIREAMPKLRALAGPGNIVVLNAQSTLGTYVETTGRLKEAFALYEEVLKNATGEGQEQLRAWANATLSLSRIYALTGKAEKCDELIPPMMQTYEAQFGRDTGFAAVLGGLAGCRLAQGKVAEANSLMERAVSVLRPQAGAGENIALVLGLKSLSAHYVNAGDNDKALKAAIEGRDVCFRISKPGDASCIDASVTVATVYLSSGRYGEADATLAQAYEDAKKAFGQNSLVAISTGLRLAAGYNGQQDYKLGRPLVEALITNAEKTLGQDHVVTLAARGMLVDMLLGQNENDLAVRKAKDFLQISKRVFGAGSQQYLGAEDSLARALDAVGLRNASLKLYEDVYKSRLKLDGLDRPVTGTAMNNYGWALAAAGKTDEGLDLLQKALEHRKRLYGAAHPETTRSSGTVGVVLAKKGQADRAVDLLEESFRASRTLIETQSDAIAGAGRRSDAMEELGRNVAYLNPIAQTMPSPKTARAAAFAILNRKGLLGDRERALLNKARQSADREIRDVAERYFVARQNLAAAYRNAISADDEARTSQRKALDVASSEVDRLERQLSYQYSAFRDTTADRFVEVKDIQRVLGPKGVLVEYVPYLKYDFDKLAWTTDGRIGAIIIRGDSVNFRDMASTPDVERNVEVYLASMGGDDAGFAASTALYSSLISPIGDLLEGATDVYIAPTDFIGRLPFDALLSPKGTAFGEGAATIHLVPTGRVLLRDREPSINSDIAVFGAPDFQANLSRPVEVAGMNRQSGGGARGAQINLAPLPVFENLSGSAAEANSVADIWTSRTAGRAHTYVGTGATERTLLDLRSPGVLHLATHGFVVSDDLSAASGRSALLSGIALAGANRRGADAMSDDGVALGFELETMDLTGTELVVVSACDTAIGATRTSEGIYSLARAFRLAGAAASLVTVKAVDDQATAQFMEDFYNEWLDNDRKSPARALQTVKTRWRNSGDSERSDPLKWAPFVLIENTLSRT